MKPSHAGFPPKLSAWCLAAAVIFAAQSASAADADNGRRLALAHCSPCHLVAPNQRREVADSPSFEAIVRKFGFDAEMIAAAILGPHPRMNMTLTPSEADDIAAYATTLPK